MVRRFLLFVSLAICHPGLSAEFKIFPDRSDGLYHAGEKVTWSIETVGLTGEEKPPAEAGFVLLSDGLGKRSEGRLPLVDGRGTFTATREDPGSLLLTLKAPGLSGISGAAFDARTLEPSLPRPADFDEFWAGKIAEVEKVPLNPILTPVPSPNPSVELWEVTLDNIKGTKVRGQLARPVGKDGKMPAMLICQWAGVYPLNKDWACEPAARGWLVLNILAHDLPLYEPKEYYDELSKGVLKDYPAIGNDDRETSYFLRMYLGCYQAIRYLKSRPDWDGKTLIVRGTSQGGMQALVTAALCRDVVTAVLANVPAGCDQNGTAKGRAPGWPQWASHSEGKDPAKVRQAAEYYDVVNFCSRIRGPALIGLGLADTTCPAPGVFVAANQIPGPVRIITMPSTGHRATTLNSQEPFYQEEKRWLTDLLAGRSPGNDAKEK